jgi:LCP family protein required for cell wall assembly
MFSFPPRRDAQQDPLAKYQSTVNRQTTTSATTRSWSRSSPLKSTQPVKPAMNWKWIIGRSLLTLFAVAIIGSTYFVISSGHGKFSLASLLGSAVETAIGKATPISGESTGRTNILVYGMTEDGLRTDSILLVSYYWQQKKIITLNIPRDLYVYDGYENDKMGEVYAYAEGREPHNTNYPDNYVASVISKEYGVPINYWVQFDMVGEVNFINAIGGIDVDVPVSFTDYQYPTWDYSGYVRPAPHFNEGNQHMDGADSLIYSRSRHSLDNGQGSDFARSQRQEQVIQATMSRLKDLGIIGNVAQVSHYLNILGDTVTTNMSTSEMVGLASSLKSLNPQTDYIKSSWETGNGFLCNGMTPEGADIVLYGTSNSCGVGAGGYRTSEYRQIAIYFVQHLITAGPMSIPSYLTVSEAALGYTPTTTPPDNPATP